MALPGANAAAPGPEAPAASRSNTPFGVWTGGGMSFGDYDLRGGNGFEFETSAITAGMDYRFSPRFVLGGGLGYGRDVTDVGENGTRSEASARSIAGYASYEMAQDFFLDLLLGYQDLSFDARRRVTTNGGMVDGERDGDQWFGSLVSTFEHREETYTLAPYLRVDIARATLDAFTETGDPIYALHYGEQDVNTTTGNLGVRMEFHNDMGWGVLSPMFRVEYQYDFEDPGAATLSYADLLGGPIYRTRLQGLDTRRLLLGLGAVLIGVVGAMASTEREEIHAVPEDEEEERRAA
jgi:outer membrane autotransporter protein